MAIAHNVFKPAGVVRIVSGVTVVLLGYSLTGLWMTLSMAVGLYLIFTAFYGLCVLTGLVLKVFSRK
jgi:hypothetical protein